MRPPLRGPRAQTQHARGVSATPDAATGGGVQPKASFAGLPRNITTCAVVGNAGHLRQKLYGPHIDNHDVVVRFNLVHKESLLNVTGHKVSLRFINHASATHLCKLSRPWLNVRLSPPRRRGCCVGDWKQGWVGHVCCLPSNESVGLPA
jgi:hypothetical protein